MSDRLYRIHGDLLVERPEWEEPLAEYRRRKALKLLQERNRRRRQADVDLAMRQMSAQLRGDDPDSVE